jgi:broad specificity phosphatase PhoE
LVFSFIEEIIDKYANTNNTILVVGHKDSSGMLDAYFNGIKIESIYDDYLKLASSNCEYKKYTITK